MTLVAASEEPCAASGHISAGVVPAGAIRSLPCEIVAVRAGEISSWRFGEGWALLTAEEDYVQGNEETAHDESQSCL